MKVRTQLIAVFLLLAVVPLTVVTVYSYRASVAAFRQAVEAESGALADDIGARMESVRTQLNRRIERLGSFPFRNFMAERRRPDHTGGPGPLSERLMSEIGDAAPLLDALEFTPAAPVVPPPPLPPHRGVPGVPPPPPVPEQLIIQLGKIEGEAPRPPGAPADNQDSRRMVVRIPLPNIPDEKLAAAGQEVAKAEAQLKNQQAMAQLRRSAAAVAEADRALTEALKQQHFRPPDAPRAHRFAFSVQTDGELSGTLKAQVSSRRVLETVLSRTRRKQGEIPFAYDSQDALYTAESADQSTLEKISIRSALKGDQPSAALKNWIVVTRKDQNSGITFGIARPVGDSFQEIRRTAVRNLGFGLGVIGLALIGILPLSQRMTRNLKTLTAGVDKLAGGKLETRVPVRSRDEFGTLAQAFNRMAEDLAKHEQNLVQQERLHKELEMCRRIQEELLPHKPLTSGIVEAKGISIPAREVGGDFFNYFPLQDGKIGVLVGDVSGKGLPAALLMANLQATIQARLPLQTDLALLAFELDEQIAANTLPELYLTLFMGILDVRAGVLRYVNAGHHTQFALHKDGRIVPLESTGRPLGLLPGGGYVDKSVDLCPGDSLFLYTDGLVESENPQGEEFGMTRLQQLLSENRSEPLETMLARVDAVLREYRGPIEAADDATMLVLKVGNK